MEVLKIRNDANSPWVDILALVGPKGFSPIAKVEQGEKTITVTVTDEKGVTSAVIDLNNYYDKQETEGAIEAAVATIDLEPYALKTEIPSLEGYSTEDWVTEQIGNIPVIDLTPYALKSEIPIIPVDISAFNNDVGYLTEHQSLEGYATEDYVNKAVEDVDVSDQLTNYALKTEIPSTEGLATEKYVDNAVANVKVDLTGYATEKYVDDAVSNVKVDLTGYATETYVQEQIALIEIPENVDLSNYALKSEIPDLTEYATKEEIPTVPTNISAFTNDKGYLTEHQDLSNYALKSEIPSVPNKVSELENDANYVTETWVTQNVVAELPNATSSIVGGITIRFENGALYIRNDGGVA